MEQGSVRIDSLKGVEKTLLLPLLSRALDFNSPKPILNDPKAVEILKQIDFNFTELQKLLNTGAKLGHPVRAKYFDNQARMYLSRFPNGLIVNIGAGLDTRFNRIDNGTMTLIDLDLPEVIALRKKLISEGDRNPFIAKSVLDPSWMSEITSNYLNRLIPILILAEAVFVYLPLKDVKDLFQLLTENFPLAEIIFEVYSHFMVKRANKNASLKEFEAEFKWGVDNSREIELWNPNLHFIEDWSFFDAPEINKGIFRLLRYIPFYTKMTRIVHYHISKR